MNGGKEEEWTSAGKSDIEEKATTERKEDAAASAAATPFFGSTARPSLDLLQGEKVKNGGKRQHGQGQDVTLSKCSQSDIKEGLVPFGYFVDDLDDNDALGVDVVAPIENKTTTVLLGIWAFGSTQDPHHPEGDEARPGAIVSSGHNSGGTTTTAALVGGPPAAA